MFFKERGRRKGVGGAGEGRKPTGVVNPLQVLPLGRLVGSFSPRHFPSMTLKTRGIGKYVFEEMHVSIWQGLMNQFRNFYLRLNAENCERISGV